MDDTTNKMERSVEVISPINSFTPVSQRCLAYAQRHASLFSVEAPVFIKSLHLCNVRWGGLVNGSFIQRKRATKRKAGG